MKSKFGGISIEDNTTTQSKFGGINIKLDELQSTSLGDKYAKYQIQTPKEPQQQGFVESVKTDFGKRTKEYGDYISRQNHPLTIDIPKTLAIGAGESLGFIGDVIGEGVLGIYKSVVSENKQEEVKEAYSRFGETKVGQLGIDAFQAGSKAFSKFEKVNPDAALAVKSMFNIFGGSVASKAVPPVVKGATLPLKGAKVSTKEVIDIVKDVSNMVKAKTDPTDLSTTRNIVNANYPKSVGLKGKHVKAEKHINEIVDNANISVRTIIEELDDIRIVDEFNIPITGVPTTLREFSQGISGAKEIMFKQYNDIAVQAGEQGVKVTLKPLRTELEKIIKDIDGIPEDIRVYASKTLAEYQKLDNVSTTGAQSRVKIFNNKLGAQLDYDSAAQAIIDNIVRNNLRKGLNDAVESISGSGKYADFKRKYSALRSIEEDVAKRAAQHASKSDVGFFDMADVYTHANLAAGLLTGSPSALARGGAGAAIKARIQFLNNPDNKVKKMFEQSQIAMDKSSYQPKSKLLKNTGKKQPKPEGIDYNIPTYLRQGKDLTKFTKNIEDEVLKNFSFIRQTKNQKLMDAGYQETAGLSEGLNIPPTSPVPRKPLGSGTMTGGTGSAKATIPQKPDVTLRQGDQKLDIKTKGELRKEADVRAIENNIDLAFARQARKQGLKGSPLTMPRNEMAKSKIPKIKTTLRPMEVKRIVKNKIEERIALEKAQIAKNVQMRMKQQAEQKASIGSPLITPRPLQPGAGKRTPPNIKQMLNQWNITP
jgi:hypothetical protein